MSWNERVKEERLKKRREEKPIPIWVWVLIVAGLAVMFIGLVGLHL
jgi:uncharacterized iron-regulated membrane protein